ncbi:hypothetical protein [Thalassotalea sp. Y01]|uniref:hypothetical protein n=1 Tax=Thalassotalea sp. Y01 TaxID=2729613 RepID=UPI00145D8FC0|nr:hypothetical protein [Thalassotalea sp. Y01]NMP16775.1 hypothetical protein [Thalassotalea sp. Y01]
MKKITTLTALSLLCFGINTAIAEQSQPLATPSDSEQVGSESTINIPVLDDAHIFSQFNDELPAMVTYFTKSDFDQVRQFYSEQFGAPSSDRIQYGRLELHFDHLGNDVRVIVDEQQSHHEVDVIMVVKQ